MKKALVVLSGGQDSTTCLFWAKANYDEVYAITFDYGQRHVAEIRAAKTIARIADVIEHEIAYIPDILRSTSPLTSDNELEQYEDADQMEDVIGNRVELTFVPMRNALFFTIAMNRAVALGCNAIVTGICQEDNANYPDCTNTFKTDFETMANRALGLIPSDLTAHKVLDSDKMIRVDAPLMHLSKAETCHLAASLGDQAWNALAYTHTSYDGKYPPTDMNHANVLRAKGFEDAGLPDPLVLRAWKEGLMELPETNNYDFTRKG